MSVFAIVGCITCFILLFSSRDLERFVRTRAPVDDDVSCMISVLLVFSSVGRCPAFEKVTAPFASRNKVEAPCRRVQSQLTFSVS